MIFRVAPYFVMVGFALTFVAMPFGESLIAADLNVGIFYMISVTALVVVGILLAGWSSNSKWALFGGMRSAAQVVSYEIPAGLAPPKPAWLEKFDFSLDGFSALGLTLPRNKEEEDAIVRSFLEGLEKLFTANNNWAFLLPTVLSTDYCMRCNTCNSACMVYESSGRQDIYRPNFRSELLRRIYRRYFTPQGKLLGNLYLTDKIGARSSAPTPDLPPDRLEDDSERHRGCMAVGGWPACCSNTSSRLTLPQHFPPSAFCRLHNSSGSICRIHFKRPESFLAPGLASSKRTTSDVASRAAQLPPFSISR